MSDSFSYLRPITADPNYNNLVVQNVTGYNDLMAKYAAAKAYQQSTDPTTGQVDPNKFNALVTQDPRSAWNAGPIMQQQGSAAGAQAQAANDQTSGHLARLSYLNGLMTPLLQSGQPISLQQVHDKINQAGADGILKTSDVESLNQELSNQQPGADLTSWVRGHAYSNAAATEQIKAGTPQPQIVHTPQGDVVVDMNSQTTRTPAGTAFPYGPSPDTKRYVPGPTPGTGYYTTLAPNYPAGTTTSPGGAPQGGGPQGGGGQGPGPTPQAMYDAITGAEGSGEGAISSAGARGPFQVTRPFFNTYAQKGESFDSEADLATVAKRGIDDLWQQYNGDPARVATAYFSGPKNVAPAGSTTPWVDSKGDGINTVPSYVNNVVTRFRAGQAKAPPAATGGAPAAAPAGGAPAAAPPATTGPLVIGDSLAMPGGLGGTGVKGALPNAVQYETGQGVQKGTYKGQDVVLSSGASNAPGNMKNVEAQLQNLRAGGASHVSLLGVGPGVEAKNPGTNANLQALAAKYGADFVPLPADQMSPDGVHPTQQGYNTLKEQLGIGVQPAPAATPAPTQVAGPGAPPAPAVTAAATPPAAPGGGVVLSPPGSAAEPWIAAQQEQSTKDYMSAQAADNSLNVRSQPLVNAIATLRANKGLQTGPAQHELVGWQTALQALGINIGDPNSVTDFQSVAKYLAQNMRGMPGANNSDLARLESEAASPNIMQSRAAIEELAAKQIGLERMASARYRQFNSQYPNASAATSNANLFNTSTQGWLANQDPVAYAADMLPTDALKRYMSGLSTDQKARWTQSYLNAKRLFGISLPTVAAQ